MAPAPTDRQLAVLVRHLTRLHLEVERGLRPPDQLEGMMTNKAYGRLRGRGRAHFPYQGPVNANRDLGTVRLTRQPDGQVYASVPTRQQHDRWGAITLQLQPDGQGRYRIADVQRLRPHDMSRHRTPTRQPTLADRIHKAADERRIVQAALDADTPQKASDGAGGRRGPMAEALNRRLDELDTELADLRHREQVRRALDEPEGRSQQEPADHVTRLLGRRPEDEDQRRLWDTACSAIEDYRETWQIDADTPLGPAPTDPEQQRHRARVTELVRTVAPQLAGTGQELDEPSRSLGRAL